MDMARTVSRAYDDEPSEIRRASGRDGLAGLDQILRALHPQEPPPEPVRPHGTIAARDFASAVGLLQQAAKTIRSNESRAQDLETRMKAIAQRANDELKSAEARAELAERRARDAEARAQEAEARLREAEEWLARIHDVIVEEFSSKRAGPVAG